MNRAERRAAAKEIAQQLGTDVTAGAVDLAAPVQPSKTVMMAFAAGAYVTTAFHRSILATASRSREFGFQARLRDIEGPYTGPAKNLFLRSFLETEDSHLLLVSTDIAFAPQDVAMLLATDAAIAGALYFSAALGMEQQPQAWVERDIPEGADPATADADYGPVSLPEPPEDLDADDPASLEKWMAELSIPIPVAGVTMGLTLIRRDVVNSLTRTYERPFEAQDGKVEDLVFCLRAAEHAFETVLVPAARVGHMQMEMV